ncbi:HAD family phosphatase [Clostridium fermenticellae]|uniref:HAD family phosphatase n=1 Tax=Clostridium fermenticellae TaxID=2068654 RepID=A0A386H5K9_9CLOT|nr:Cof-type HAD-IIB family hydrolase [Clostridium fermenticellae]AYD40940.1 HAD family phosphatase [Clostridium fermenticellae]
MKYKMIAVDMDGTLLNDKKHISDYNMKMIDRATKLGVKFVVASGRVPAALRVYEESVSKNQPMICCNGAIILDDNKNIIQSNFVPKQSAIEAINLIRKENKDVYFHIYHDGILCSEQFKYSAESFYNFNRSVDKKYGIEIHLLRDAKEYIELGNYNLNKIVVMDDDIGFLNNIRSKLDEVQGLEVTKSEFNNIELLSKGTSKGNALKILANFYKIPMEQCIAVGNDENDISMIMEAGLGVYMKNTREKIKNSADYITKNDNNNGGVGEIIEKFILDEN